METWKTPQLIELVRSSPEEAVLTACKNGVLDGTSTAPTPTNFHALCVAQTPGTGPEPAQNCTLCSSLPTS